MTVFYEGFGAVLQVIFGGFSMRFLDFRQEFVDIPRICQCSDGLEDLSGASQVPEPLKTLIKPMVFQHFVALT